MTAEAGRWLEIAVEVAGIDAETVADAFRQCCSGGVAIEPAARLEGEAYVVDGDAAALVKGYLPPGEDSAGVRRSLRLALRFAPLERPPRWRRARRLREEDWRDSWKRYFRPQRIGRRLVVKPSWATYGVTAAEKTLRPIHCATSSPAPEPTIPPSTPTVAASAKNRRMMLRTEPPSVLTSATPGSVRSRK